MSCHSFIVLPYLKCITNLFMFFLHKCAQILFIFSILLTMTISCLIATDRPFTVVLQLHKFNCPTFVMSPWIKLFYWCIIAVLLNISVVSLWISQSLYLCIVTVLLNTSVIPWWICYSLFLCIVTVHLNAFVMSPRIKLFFMHNFLFLFELFHFLFFNAESQKGLK